MLRKYDLDQLFSSLVKGNTRSASQLMTLLDDQGPESDTAVRRLYALDGKALVVGVTGWPGVGKSSLINRIAKVFLDEGRRVGIVAIDPTSPLSGRGLLGDRLRFKDIDGRANVFIRSVASRGYHGGVSRSTYAFTKVMEAMGCDIILLETIGIGQDQVTVSLVADTTIVVVAPGLGDFMQAIKAGILEVADIFVVNKSDREGAHRTVQDLEASIQMREQAGWCPSVVKTVALDGSGLEGLMAEIRRHAAYCATNEKTVARKIRAAEGEIREAVKARLLDHFFGPQGLKGQMVTARAWDISERKTEPYLVADLILEEKGIFNGKGQRKP